MRKRLKIMNRLNELKYFRDNGLTKFNEVDEMNEEKAKREQQLKVVDLHSVICFCSY
jgi:hypothetical protein